MTTREQYNQMIAALEAAREGKPVDYRPKGSTIKWENDILPSWNFDCWEWRPAPEPKPPRWVAFRAEQVPLGAWFRFKPDTWNRSIIVRVNTVGLFLPHSDKGIDFNEVLQCGEISIDQGKTWQPCGALVKEEGE